MKKNILTLIIGILIGAIVSTSVLLLIKNSSRNDMPNFDEKKDTMNFENRQSNDSNSEGDTQESSEQ